MLKSVRCLTARLYDANESTLENEVDDAEKNPFHVEDTSSHDSLMSHLQHIADAASAAGHKIEDALAKAPKKMTDTEAKNLKAHALKLDPITQKIKDALDKALHSPALSTFVHTQQLHHPVYLQKHN